MRNEEKQIEEMAKDMLEASTSANVEPILEIEGKEVVLGENATKILNNILEQAYIPFLAETLTNAGYRKASEVAREIFAEIEQAIENTAFLTYWHEGGFRKRICELKKKYESEGEK